MSDVKSFVFPDNGGNFGNNGLEGMLVGSMLNGGGYGGGGMWNNPIWAIVFLAALRNGGIFGNNGWDGNGAHPCTTSQLTAIQETLNSNHGQTLLMDAIKGNGNAVHELATTIGCNFNAVQGAISSVKDAICSVGNQNGMGQMQIINSIQAGNTAIANQIAQCCCDNKLLVQQQGYENRINNIEQSNMITKGFGDIAYGTQAQTTALAANNDANTRAVLAKLDAIEDSRKDREIASLTAALAQKTAAENLAIQLAPLKEEVNEIKCKQPNTVTVPYSPFVTVPSCVAWNAGLSALSGYGLFGANGGVFG